MPALVNTAEDGAGLFSTERITADKQPIREPAAGDPQTGCGPGPGLARNSCVRLESTGYSVHPAVIGRLIGLTADLARLPVSRAQPPADRQTQSAEQPVLAREYKDRQMNTTARQSGGSVRVLLDRLTYL